MTYRGLERWPWTMDTFFRAIMERYPDLVNHLPGESIRAVLLPRADVDPRYHRVIEDQDLTAMARSAIVYDRVHRHTDLHLSSDPDAVLVIAPAQ